MRILGLRNYLASTALVPEFCGDAQPERCFGSVATVFSAWRSIDKSGQDLMVVRVRG